MIDLIEERLGNIERSFNLGLSASHVPWLIETLRKVMAECDDFGLAMQEVLLERDSLRGHLEEITCQRDDILQRWATASAKTCELTDNLRSKLAKAREALVGIRNELGVPQPGYPAPVANASELAEQALADLEDSKLGESGESTRSSPGTKCPVVLASPMQNGVDDRGVAIPDSPLDSIPARSETRSDQCSSADRAVGSNGLPHSTVGLNPVAGVVCWKCDGSGESYELGPGCSRCKGTGRVQEVKA